MLYKRSFYFYNTNKFRLLLVSDLFRLRRIVYCNIWIMERRICDIFYSCLRFAPHVNNLQQYKSGARDNIDGRRKTLTICFTLFSKKIFLCFLSFLPFSLFFSLLPFSLLFCLLSFSLFSFFLALKCLNILHNSVPSRQEVKLAETRINNNYKGYATFVTLACYSHNIELVIPVPLFSATPMLLDVLKLKAKDLRRSEI